MIYKAYNLLRARREEISPQPTYENSKDVLLAVGWVQFLNQSNEFSSLIY